MGCAPSRKKRPTIQKGIVSTNSAILPGTFIRINDNGFTDVYEIGGKLGSGAYAEVRSCTHRLHKASRAVKIIDKNMLSTEAIKAQFIQEVEILKLLDHPNIVRAYEFFEDQNKLYIVMEQCKGGELFDEIIKHQQFSEYQTAQIIRQVFSCIAYLHGIGVAHRDIKPENLLLDEKDDIFNIKLIDFGVAVKIGKSGLTGIIGTPSYLAPEVIDGTYNEKCDVWSAGVIMYILLSGCPPFQNDVQEEMYNSIKDCDYIIEGYEWDSISDDAKDLIKKILVPQKSRLTAEKALQHRWLTKQLKKDKKTPDSLKLMLDKLVDFNVDNKLQEATKLFIITQLMSTKEIKEARDIFQELDENGDGKLSREELLNGYKKFIPAKSAEALVDKIMKEVDSDNSGFIDYNEFLKAAVDIQTFASPEYLQSAFNLFDKDNSGKISIDELKLVLGQERDPEVFDQIIKQVDKNGDGEIDIEEFAAILKNMKVNKSQN